MKLETLVLSSKGEEMLVNEIYGSQQLCVVVVLRNFGCQVSDVKGEGVKG